MDLESRRAHAGLCADCRFSRVIRSDRGTAFFQCAKSIDDPRFPKYPRLPVVSCTGYEAEAR